MAGKNGLVQPESRELTTAQREHLMMLVGRMNTAQVELEAAQRAHETAQANANGFLAYCAKEHGTHMAPWRFVQEQMTFVYDAPDKEQEEETPLNGRVVDVAA